MNKTKDRVIEDIEKVYKHGDCKYAIWNYVPYDYWVKSFKSWFSGMYFENETDFNLNL